MAIKKVVISCAVTGSIHTPSLSPYFPATPDQIVQQAVGAYNAGAAVLHIHARNEEGKPVGDFETFGYILSRIKKQCPDAIIGITTGGANGMSTEERFSIIEYFKPEMASANAGSMNFCYHTLLKDVDSTKFSWEEDYVTRTYDNVFKNTFKDIEYCLKTMTASGTLPEYEVFDLGQINNLAFFKKAGLLPDPIYIQFVPGVLGGYPATNENAVYMIEQAKKLLGNDIQYSTVAPGRRMFRIATFMALNGGNVRVGMEDGLYIKPNGELAQSCAEQVVKIKRILEALDFEIASPGEAREMLRLKGADKVSF